MRSALRLLSLWALSLCTPLLLAAQGVPTRPSHSFVVSGYGTAGWLKTQRAPNGAFASLNPVLLFRMTDKIFAEAELEFEFEEGPPRPDWSTRPFTTWPMTT